MVEQVTDKEVKLKKQKDNLTRLMWLGLILSGVGTLMMVGQSIPQGTPVTVIVVGAGIVAYALFKLNQVKQGK